MNPFVTFVLGLLIGWLVEWVIDWTYWRWKNTVQKVDGNVNSRGRVAELEQEVASYKNQLESLQAERVRMDTVDGTKAAVRSGLGLKAAVPPPRRRDSLDEIKWVNSAIEQGLNDAGIYTFVDLGALSPLKLNEILAGQSLQSGSEVEIIKLARLNAGMIKKLDDLEVIEGIGPVIARTLNNAGIFTFAELSVLTVNDLREIVGEKIQKLADEDKLLAQAKQLAEDQSRGG